MKWLLKKARRNPDAAVPVVVGIVVGSIGILAVYGVLAALSLVIH